MDMTDFCANASAEEQTAYFAAIARVISIAGLEKSGYRLIANTGTDGHQDVPHLHIHILGGEAVGPICIARPSHRIWADILKLPSDR